jgi:hypothetical protein
VLRRQGAARQGRWHSGDRRVDGLLLLTAIVDKVCNDLFVCAGNSARSILAALAIERDIESIGKL